ncbi:hypothetical protein BDD12DRAFT_881012 [Trichophaea hybrida]|nr:hypothetical protein BDD12DRAFT_881012 [Trichophaea hybrida]
MEIANSANTEAAVDSQTSTDYRSFPTGISTTPTQMNYGSFPTEVQATEETNYGSFPDRVTTTKGEMDHEQSTVEDPKDDTMTEVGENEYENDYEEGTVRVAFSSPLSTLESTPKARRVPNDMFNRPTTGGSLIGRRYHQEVRKPETLNISPRGLSERGDSQDKSGNDVSDEEPQSPSVCAAFGSNFLVSSWSLLLHGVTGQFMESHLP